MPNSQFMFSSTKLSEGSETVSIARRKAVRVRSANSFWRDTSLQDRLQIVERFRHALAASPSVYFGEIAPTEPLERHEWLVAQVGPLLDACAFLERSAAKVLKQRPLGPRWACLAWWSVHGEVFREPWGTVLILAPSNYPLFLPAVQTLQALVAGNTVLWKPAPGNEEIGRCVRQRLLECGLPPEVLRILPSSVGSVKEALTAGVDKVVLTGSSETGKQVLRLVAEHTIPATMELSGSDGCLVCDADTVESAARAVAFAVHLNAGRTCVAPRRIWIPSGCTGRFVEAFRQAWESRGKLVSQVSLDESTLRAVQEAQQQGAVLVQGSSEGRTTSEPWILTRVSSTMKLLQGHWFAPLLCIGEFSNEDQAVAAMNASACALGASIFASNTVQAQNLAHRLRAGVVIINDLVAPTAHPYVPFGGAGSSGFGVTRGPEGLLEMTRPKALLRQSMSSPPHHAPPRQGDTELIAAWLALVHGAGFRPRFQALYNLIQCARRRGTADFIRSSRSHASESHRSIQPL